MKYELYPKFFFVPYSCIHRHSQRLPGSLALIGGEIGEPVQRLPITARCSHQEGSLQRPRKYRGTARDTVQSC